MSWEDRLNAQWKKQDETGNPLEATQHIHFESAPQPIVEFGPVANSQHIATKLHVVPRVSPPIVATEGIVAQSGNAPKSEIPATMDWPERPEGPGIGPPPFKDIDDQPAPWNPQPPPRPQTQVPPFLRAPPTPGINKTRTPMQFNIKVNTHEPGEGAVDLILLEKKNVHFWKTCGALGLVSTIGLLSALAAICWYRRRHRVVNITEVNALPNQDGENKGNQEASLRCADCGRYKNQNRRTVLCCRGTTPRQQHHTHHHRFHHCTCHHRFLDKNRDLHPGNCHHLPSQYHTPPRDLYSESTSSNGSASARRGMPVVQRRHFVRRPVWEV